uniref:Integrase catalytic domain-containing protein n=1 Tax=Fagus sylvatica TaxID=28930 RepID=A0A2N9IDU9_FAGSY
MGNGEKALVEFIGVVNLPLASGGVLVLDDVVYVPSLRRSLISVSKLDSSGFGFHFGNKRFALYFGSREIASGALCDGLYKLDLDPNYPSSHKVFATIGSKRVNDEFSSMLWHRRLGHISRERMERLTRNGILDSLDFSDFHTCVDCVKGKLTRARKKGATRTEIELKQEKKIKIVRSDRGGEFYGRYGEAGQIPGPFAKFLQECGVDAQYTMPGEPEQNGVAERRNRTLIGHEVRPYDPSLKKLDPRSVSGYFIGETVVNEVVQPSRFAFEEERVAIPVPPSLESAVSLPLTEHVDEAIPIPDGFQVSGKEHMVCKLKKSIYGLKQASRQWYLKFDNVVTSFGFKENPVDHCIYLKISGSKIIFLVLYVDDILLASNDLGLLRETKRFLFDNFEMKDLGEASFVLGIEIHRDRSRGILGLSQKSYINRVLERFNMSTCSAGDAPVVKGDKLSKLQCPQNDLERNEMKKIPYASAVGSLMYAQVCTRPDIAFAISVLGRFQSDPGMDHWRAAKKVLRYLQRTKDFMLTYRRSDLLEVIGYADADYAGCADDLKSTSGYVFMLAGGAISWKSVKQTLTASSTMQAEYVACYEATLQAVWLRNFISRLEIVDSISKPLTIYNDNSAAVCFSKNNKRSSRIKTYAHQVFGC